MRLVAVLVTLLPHAGHAMSMAHYEIDSLVYLSTDIVVATLSVDAGTHIIATVTDVLYGDLKPGEALDTLSPFLTFFQPIEAGQKLFLFLDRRPRRTDFFNPEASKSPFAVVPSGVYLIDEYDHVHQFYQRNNPGPYVAQGYSFFIEKAVPTKEQDLALPSLADVRQRITASLNYVRPLRELLDKEATAQDAPALLQLLDASAKRRKSCDSDAIIDRLGEQLRSLNDPEIALRSFALAPDARVPIELVNDGGNPNVEFTARRVKYLLETLSDRKQDIALRIAALEVLLHVSRFHDGPQTGPSKSLPIDNQWLRAFAGQIQSTAKSIFDADSENDHLRSLCLQFMALDQPEIAADLKKVYERTTSEELRFTIEDLSLSISDAAYERLNPPGGPIASIILAAPAQSCIKPEGDNTAFVVKYHLRRDLNEKEYSATPQIVLTQPHTARRFTPKFTFLSGWSSTSTGETWFALTLPIEVPAGEYYLTADFGRKGQAMSTSRKQVIAIVDTRNGRRVAVPRPE